MAICAALVKFDYKEPSIQQIAEYNGFTESEINMMELFWSDNFNENWIYLSDEMILNNMTNETKKNALSNFYTQVLFINFTINVDYKEIKKDDELIKKYDNIFDSLKNGNQKNKAKMVRKKYYAITGETYKELLILSANKKGKEARKYYLKIEKLAMFYHMYISELHKHLSQEKDKQLKIQENKVMHLNDFVEAVKELKTDEIFYIATTDSYARQHRFEYGGIKNANELKPRLSTYNTGRAEGDTFYYVNIFKCHKYSHIENCIEMLIKSFKDKKNAKKEMIHMYYENFVELVEFIINNYNKDIDFINTHAKQFLENTITLDPVIIPPIDLGVYAPKQIKFNKIDVSNWNNDQIKETIVELINQYAIKLGKQYDFNTQKDIEPLEIIWKDFQTYLIQYKGKNKTSWKTYLKTFVTGSKFSYKWR
jgi:phage anti-repressor protein